MPSRGSDVENTRRWAITGRRPDHAPRSLPPENALSAIAARRLVSLFHSGAADNFLAAVAEIDRAERWKAVAIMLAGDVAPLAWEVHGEDAQTWLDHRLASLLDRRDPPR